MIGYLKAYFPDLRMYEYKQYKAFYCGICLDMKDELGELPRFLLNYDVTFMAIVMTAVMGESVEQGTHRCILNPFQKKMIYRNQWTNYVAKLNLLFSYMKIEDDIRDDHSMRSKAAKIALKRKYEKVVKQYKREAKIIEQYNETLLSYEAQKSSQYEQMGQAFGTCLRDLFEPLIKEETTKKAVGNLFYEIGQWIYNIDALDDVREDEAEKSFNPFLPRYQENPEAMLKEAETYFSKLLFRLLQCYDELNLSSYEGIINNVICVAIRRKTSDVLSKYKGEDCCEKTKCKNN